VIAVLAHAAFQYCADVELVGNLRQSIFSPLKRTRTYALPPCKSRMVCQRIEQFLGQAVGKIPPAWDHRSYDKRQHSNGVGGGEKAAGVDVVPAAGAGAGARLCPSKTAHQHGVALPRRSWHAGAVAQHDAVSR